MRVWGWATDGEVAMKIHNGKLADLQMGFGFRYRNWVNSDLHYLL